MDAVLLGKMLDAGFTKEEIMKLIPEEPTTSQANAAVDEPKPVDAEPAAPTEPEPKAPTEPEPKAPDPDQGPAADNNAAMEKRLSGIEKSISDLVKTMQAENRKRDTFGGSTDSLEDETDRIMKNMIRPETKRKDV